MKNLDAEQKARIERHFADCEALYSPYAAKDAQAVRIHRNYPADALRSQFCTDGDRIINCKFFNRGNDKTQVFSFCKNDDITRRSSHVQLVSRVARKIGRALRLNLELIEAIAIGHDIGHTPFGHAGERILSDLYYDHAGKRFNHNVHSVRVLNLITHNNLSVQTLDGILCHCGEEVHEKYEPSAPRDPRSFYDLLNSCYTDPDAIKRLRPSTLEGCVVRLSDMIAYIGKDRQDAMYSLKLDIDFEETTIGSKNRDVIDRVTQDVIANSLDKPYLSLDADVYAALDRCKRENYEKIYKRPDVTDQYNEYIAPMTKLLYEKFLADVLAHDEQSLIYKHYLHDGYIRENYFSDFSSENYPRIDDPNDMVVDFIASMTDDYFIDAFALLFPNSKLNNAIRFSGYFD